jgi:class 3 adenylate cyclase
LEVLWLCDEAKPGQILISARVLMAVEDTIAVEPVGEFALRYPPARMRPIMCWPREPDRAV